MTSPCAVARTRPSELKAMPRRDGPIGDAKGDNTMRFPEWTSQSQGVSEETAAKIVPSGRNAPDGTSGNCSLHAQERVYGFSKSATSRLVRMSQRPKLYPEPTASTRPPGLRAIVAVESGHRNCGAGAVSLTTSQK